MKTTTTQAGTRKHSDFARDFTPAVRRALTKRGIFVIDVCTIPGEGDMPYANGCTGYYLDDNGTQRLRTRSEVVAIAEGRA